MALSTQVIAFSICVIISESTMHHGLLHGMMGMPMYGSPYMYPGTGMGMGMYHGGPMMHGMGPGFMPFKEVADTEADNSENNEDISPEKTESGNPELTPFQEHNDPGSVGMIRRTNEERISYKDKQAKSGELTTETIHHLVKREVAKSDDKNDTDLASNLPIIFPTEDVEETLVKLEKAKENNATESSIESEHIFEATDKSVSEKDTPELARNNDYIMIPVVQAASPDLFDSYVNQRDVQKPLAVYSQSIDRGLNRQDIAPNLNNYQRNIANQIPMDRNQINSIPQNYNVVPVNNIGNAPGVLTFVTLPNNMGAQAGNVLNNQQYYTVPQNIVSRAGIQNTPSYLYNVVPINQPQHNLIGFLAQPTATPLNNQYSNTNGVPINNQLVNAAQLNNHPNNVLPVSNYVPANNYVLVNAPQHAEPLLNQAGLNAWNVPVGNQAQNYNQQPQIYNQQALHQQPKVVMLNRQPNDISTASNPNNFVAQLSSSPNENIPVSGQTQPLNDNSQYVPVYNTKDEVVKEEINS